MRGWSNSFVNPLIVTALDNTLRLAYKALYKHPFLVTYDARMPALLSHMQYRDPYSVM